jgi:uroporphyrinogen-III synthase
VKPIQPGRVVVTRPAEQAEPWVRKLREAGIDATSLPLIDIVAVTDAAPLAAAWETLASRRLVVFVSVNAVLHFFAARPPQAAWPATLVAAAPGPGTVDALREAGLHASGIVAPASDAMQFDSESLWQRLRARDWAGASVLVVRGGGGRDWLADRLVEAGATVDRVDAYSRSLPVLDAPARARLDALAGDAGVVWLFSSSQAIAHLQQLAGSNRWSTAAAVVTHPRIAATAWHAGFGRVGEAGAGLDAVVACIQSMRP